jgi:hypothetical protein
MDVSERCRIMFSNKHQSERVVVASEESIVALCPQICAMPSFALA